MLYLFNSAGDKKYVVNVLNTLSLPIGTENVYQYTINTVEKNYDNCYVEISMLQKIQKRQEKHERLFRSTEKDVLIIFVDRDNRQRDDKYYRYIPLRKAVLQKIIIEDDRIYFTVRLGDYCNTKAIEKFNSYLIDKMGDKLFRPIEGKTEVDGEKEKGHFGYLASCSDDDYSVLEIESTSNSWSITVQELGELPTFIMSKVIFTKLKIVKKNTQTQVNIKGNQLRLVAGKKYSISVSHYCPYGNKNRDASGHLVYDKSLLSFLGEPKRQIDNRKGMEYFQFYPIKSTRSGAIGLQTEISGFFKTQEGESSGDQSENTEPLICSTKGVFFQTKLPLRRYAFIGILLLVAAFTMGDYQYLDCTRYSLCKFLMSSLLKVIAAVAIWLAGKKYYEQR